jgi:hypothetical protein
MATDDGLHLLGSKLEHQIPAWIIVAVGLLLDITWVQSLGIGMMLVLIFGNMRAQSPYYRWRVDS